MSDITNGEWRVATFQLGDRLAILIGAHDNDDMPHTVIAEIKNYPGFEYDERLADANLMAAAPTLQAENVRLREALEAMYVLNKNVNLFIYQISKVLQIL